MYGVPERCCSMTVLATSPDVAFATAEALPLGDLLVTAAHRWPHRPAIITEDERLSYADLLEHSVRTAQWLLALGVERGDRVGMLLPNGVDFVATLFGIALAGGTFVPMNSRLQAEEIAHVVRSAELLVLVTSGDPFGTVDLPGRVRAAMPHRFGEHGIDATPLLRHVLHLGAADHEGFIGRPQLDKLAVGASSVVHERRSSVRIRDRAAILFTSGTSARPKGACHSHEGLVRNGLITGRTRFHLDVTDRFWNPLPMAHVGFLLPMIAAIDAGAAILAMKHFTAAAALDQIETERATWLFPAFPAIANDLLDDPSFVDRDLSLVRMTMLVGPPAQLRRLQHAIPHAVQISTYGSTETGGVITYHLSTDSAESRAETCGPPMAGTEIAVSDVSTGEHVGRNVEGELLVRGPSTFDSYYNDPAATSSVIDDAGWFHTGDLGLVNDDGHVVYRGRLKDMLKVGGENVAAAEVEAVIAEDPRVRAVQVVGVKDERLEEVVGAVIELADGATMPTLEEVTAMFRGRLATFKHPRYLARTSDWPMSATKVMKHEVRRQLNELVRGHVVPGMVLST